MILSLLFLSLVTLKLIKCLQEVCDAIIELFVLSTELIGFRLSTCCSLGLATTFNLFKRGTESLVIALTDSEQLSIMCFHSFANCVRMNTLFRLFVDLADLGCQRSDLCTLIRDNLVRLSDA